MHRNGTRVYSSVASSCVVICRSQYDIVARHNLNSEVTQALASHSELASKGQNWRGNRVRDQNEMMSFPWKGVIREVQHF